MRVAIITDQHFGVRGDSIHFLEYYEKFYAETFFPKLCEEGVNTLLVLGDTFDHRKSVNFNTLHQAKSMFFNILKKNSIEVYMLVGNHDTYFKNTNKVNSPELLLAEYDNINVISEPSTITLDGVDICMIPWICSENVEDSKAELTNTSASICMGHFEIAGFAMHRGMESEEGLDRSMFNRFGTVFSGHYHHKSSKGNIHYLGNPAQLTWSDYDDPRGFHLFNVHTQELEFVENPNIMYHKIVYDDTQQTAMEINDMDIDHLKNKFIKVIVSNKTNPVLYDQFVARLDSVGPLDLTLIEDGIDLTNDIEDDIIDEAEDTISTINRFVDIALIDGIESNRAKTMMRELYIEALNTEQV